MRWNASSLCKLDAPALAQHLNQVEILKGHHAAHLPEPAGSTGCGEAQRASAQRHEGFDAVDPTGRAALREGCARQLQAPDVDLYFQEYC